MSNRQGKKRTPDEDPLKNIEFTTFLYVVGKSHKGFRRYARKYDDRGIAVPPMLIKPTNPRQYGGDGYYTMSMSVALAFGLAPGQ
jgi:hypothetical protein